MGKSNLKASIVIPMYNAERTITENLNALQKQTEKNFEVIIVDDGSTDISQQIVKKYNSNFPLRILSQKNSGPAAARNNGARHAKSSILIFTDSDCIPRKDFIEKILLPFKDKKVYGVQGEYETKNKEFLMARYFGYESYYRHESMKNKPIDHMATYACAYKKSAFGKGFSDIFKKANMEDTELSYRLAKENKKLVFTPDAIVKHPHPPTFLKFMKQQHSRGYWRVQGHLKHPDKLVKDSYLGNSMVIQGGLSSLFLLSALFYLLSLPFSSPVKFIWLPLVILAVMYLSNFYFGIYCFKYEKKMLVLAPLLASARSISGTLGFLQGIFHFKFVNKFK